MLLVERNVTLPSEYVKRQVNVLINNYLNNIEQNCRSGNCTRNEMISRYENKLAKNDGWLYVGELRTKDLETNKNIK